MASSAGGGRGGGGGGGGGAGWSSSSPAASDWWSARSSLSGGGGVRSGNVASAPSGSRASWPRYWPGQRFRQGATARSQAEEVAALLFQLSA
eukprot:8312380-Alexandrium_andersonii.AAC.5